jgi:hypothetical protein
MSMICNLRHVNDEEIDKLLENPQYIYEFLYGEPRPTKRKGIFSFLFSNKSSKPPESGPEWVRNAERLEADLDKAWHGIHFLLTGTDWEGDEPLCYLVKGGQAFGDIDVGWGPARGLKTAQVMKFANALNAINVEELKSKFDAEKMMKLDIYPTIWDRDPKEDDTLGYLIEYFYTLKSFVNRAVERKKGLIIYLN